MFLDDFIEKTRLGLIPYARKDFRYNGVLYKAGSLFDPKKCLSQKDLVLLFNAHRLSIKEDLNVHPNAMFSRDLENEFDIEETKKALKPKKEFKFRGK